MAENAIRTACGIRARSARPRDLSPALLEEAARASNLASILSTATCLPDPSPPARQSHRDDASSDHNSPSTKREAHRFARCLIPVGLLLTARPVQEAFDQCRIIFLYGSSKRVKTSSGWGWSACGRWHVAATAYHADPRRGGSRLPESGSPSGRGREPGSGELPSAEPATPDSQETRMPFSVVERNASIDESAARMTHVTLYNGDPESGGPSSPASRASRFRGGRLRPTAAARSTAPSASRYRRAPRSITWCSWTTRPPGPSAGYISMPASTFGNEGTYTISSGSISFPKL